MAATSMTNSRPVPKLCSDDLVIRKAPGAFSLPCRAHAAATCRRGAAQPGTAPDPKPDTRPRAATLRNEKSRPQAGDPRFANCGFAPRPRQQAWMRGQLDLRDVFTSVRSSSRMTISVLGSSPVDPGETIPLQALMTMVCMMRSPFYALFDFAKHLSLTASARAGSWRC